MHSSDSDACRSGEVKKNIRTYLMVGAALFVFTGITVAVNQVHLAVPLAITVALIIATMKGSMVASVFMHLSHEKKWIYGALILTVIGFVILMLVPSLTISDGIGTPIHVEAPAGGARGALRCRCGRFTWSSSASRWSSPPSWRRGRAAVSAGARASATR